MQKMKTINRYMSPKKRSSYGANLFSSSLQFSRPEVLRVILIKKLWSFMLLFVNKRDSPKTVLKRKSWFQMIELSQSRIEELGQKSVVNSFSARI